MDETATHTDVHEEGGADEAQSSQPMSEKLGALDLKDEPTLGACVEAILLTTDKPLTSAKLAQALSLDGSTKPGARIDRAIESLNDVYEQTGRSFRIQNVAGGYRVMTEPDFAPALLAMHGIRQSHKLSKPALETLAIVAYRQPATRAHIEAIRGVSCGEVLKSLLERRLLDIVGRAEELGRPMLYGTSKNFLEIFGLSSIRDLPTVSDIPDMPGVRGTAEEAAGAGGAGGDVEVKPVKPMEPAGDSGDEHAEIEQGHDDENAEAVAVAEVNGSEHE